MLRYERIDMRDRNAIKAFIEANSTRFARQFFRNSLSEEKVVAEHMFTEMIEKLRSGVAFCARTKSELKALAIITRSEWDSEILEKKIGKLVVYSLLSREETDSFFQRIYPKVAQMNLDAIFVRVDIEQMDLVQSLLRKSAILGDVLVTLGKNLCKGEQIARKDIVGRSDLIFENGTPAHEEKLTKITASSYQYSHYFNDLNISLARAEKIYQEWIKNSLHGFADIVVIAKLKEEVVGYITLRLNMLGERAFGTIDLIAVEERLRGQGIGRMLVTEGIGRVQTRSSYLYVSTQVSNLPALRLYQDLGFEPLLSEATLHIWTKSAV